MALSSTVRLPPGFIPARSPARNLLVVLLNEKVLEIALSQVGKEENPRGSNQGTEVNAYLASVHLPPGNAWCAAFVSWCILEATKAVGGPPLFKPSGSALGLLHANPELVVDSPGNDACYVFIKVHADHVHGHAGFWVPMNRTVEGNSNDNGDREGYEVCRLNRQFSEMKGYLRIG